MIPAAEEWAERIAGGDVRALARAASAIENHLPAAAPLLDALRARPRRALRVGITGGSGVGKSSLVDGLTRALRRDGLSVGILAVDPSSPYSGGALLGDRIRMQGYHDDPAVYIRSMSSRGHLGGLAATTRNLALLLDAAGRDVILVETVGVGQAEVEVASLGGVTVLVLAPGTGDHVQTLKAGILEIADIFVLNQADRPGADALERDILDLLSLDAAPAALVRTVATEDRGIAELLAAIRAHRPRDARPLLETEGYLIHHVGIAVRSLDDALAFYEGTLGLRAAARESLPAEMVHLAMLPASGSRLELIAPSSPDSPVARFLEKRGQGLHHIALSVPDLPVLAARLRAQGVRLVDQLRRGAGGHWYVFVHPAAAGGVLLELIQREQEPIP